MFHRLWFRGVRWGSCWTGGGPSDVGIAPELRLSIPALVLYLQREGSVVGDLDTPRIWVVPESEQTGRTAGPGVGATLWPPRADTGAFSGLSPCRGASSAGGVGRAALQVRAQCPAPFRPRPSRGSASPLAAPPIPRGSAQLLARPSKPRPSSAHRPSPAPAPGPRPSQPRAPSLGGAAEGPRAFCVGFGPPRALALQRPRAGDARARSPQRAESRTSVSALVLCSSPPADRGSPPRVSGGRARAPPGCGAPGGARHLSAAPSPAARALAGPGTRPPRWQGPGPSCQAPPPLPFPAASGPDARPEKMSPRCPPQPSDTRSRRARGRLPR